MPRSICIYSAAVASIMVMTTDPGSAEIDPVYTERLTFFFERRPHAGAKREEEVKDTLVLNCGYSHITTEVIVAQYDCVL